MSACSGKELRVTIEVDGNEYTATVTCGATESCADCIDRAVALAKQQVRAPGP